MHDNQMLPGPAAEPAAMGPSPKNEPKHETPFHTPDEIATNDKSTPSSDHNYLDDNKKGDHSPPIKKKWWKVDWRRLEWPPSKRQTIVAVVIIVLAAGGGAGFALSGNNHNSTYKVFSPYHKPKVVITSPLTGLPVTGKQTKLPVTGVMIENSLPARPQAGLGSAGVVFEAIAEAGITRFLALYQEAQPQNVGPIRSARPYFVRWAQGFDAGYAHVGGSPEALQDIRAWNVRDLDQFYNAGAYHRIASRYAPHNMYTSMSQLRQLEKSKGYNHSKFTGFPRKKDAPSKKPTAKNIDFNISSPDYNVHYTYKPKSNTYARFEGGTPHIDANNNKQIHANVVIALLMPYALEADGYHSSYSNIGNGPAYIFQDGTVQKGTWHKKSRRGQITFVDAKNKEIKLNAGKTWITALKSPNEIVYR